MISDFLDLKNPKHKKLIGYYIIWVGINVILLSIGLSLGSGTDNSCHTGFFPFYTPYYCSFFSTYDFSEFLAYTVVPVIGYLAYHLLFTSDKTPNTQTMNNDFEARQIYDNQQHEDVVNTQSQIVDQKDEEVSEIQAPTDDNQENTKNTGCLLIILKVVRGVFAVSAVIYTLALIGALAGNSFAATPFNISLWTGIVLISLLVVYFTSIKINRLSS